MKLLSLEKVQPTVRLAKSVFTSDGKVLLTAGQLLEPRFVTRLKTLGFSHVYVEDDLTKDVVIEDIVSEQLRSEVVATLRSNLETMRHKKATFRTEHLFSLMDELIDEVTSQKNLLISFMDIRSSEDYLYAHSVNTCLLAMAIGASFFTDKGRLKDLGIGALLHDAGMAHIPVEITGKKARLTPPERKIMQTHTEKGYQLMKTKHEVSLLSAHTAYQHHERYDGSGYPRGLSENQIHQFARITSVCSVYDALTSPRPFRKRLLPDRAFATLLAESKKAFDPEVVKAFAERVAIYPIGIAVRLNNRMEGVVISVQKGLTHRPTIRVTKDEKGRPLSESLDINLLQERTLFVEEILE